MENSICGIYKISSICKPSRFYIGSSVDVYHRWIEHKSNLSRGKHHSPKIQNHYNKYGVNDLSFEVIEYCTRNNLLEREQYYLDTLNPWFNTYPIAGSPLGHKPTKEHVEKVRRAGLGRIVSEETRKKISEAHMGMRTSEEAKSKQRAAKLGGKLSEEHKAKIGESLRGTVRSEEYKEKIRQTLMGHAVSEETKRKISENNGVAVMIINIETGICFNSIMEAAIAYSLTHSQLSYRLRVGGKYPFRRVSEYGD
jgi:group I intron endonuclease